MVPFLSITLSKNSTFTGIEDSIFLPPVRAYSAVKHTSLQMPPQPAEKINKIIKIIIVVLPGLVNVKLHAR